MSLEAIREVSEAQVRAEGSLSKTAEQARLLISDAEASGKILLDDCRKTEGALYAEALAEAEKEARKKNEAVLKKAEQSSSDLAAKAEQKLPDAVSLILGRVVKG